MASPQTSWIWFIVNFEYMWDREIIERTDRKFGYVGPMTFYPTAIHGCVGIVVNLAGRVGRWAVCPGQIFVTISWKKFILGTHVPTMVQLCNVMVRPGVKVNLRWGERFSRKYSPYPPPVAIGYYYIYNIVLHFF